MIIINSLDWFIHYHHFFEYDSKQRGERFSFKEGVVPKVLKNLKGLAQELESKNIKIQGKIQKSYS